MERRTGHQESMERISKNSKVRRKPPNYAESRKVTRKRSRFVRRGATGKGPLQGGTSPVAYSTLNIRSKIELKGRLDQFLFLVSYQSAR
jgi:hypothetical protein